MKRRNFLKAFGAGAVSMTMLGCTNASGQTVKKGTRPSGFCPKISAPTLVATIHLW